MPKEESFPVPLKYIDVIRSTHTDLDVAQEKRIDDYWNVEGNRNLSDSWTGFASFTLLNEILREDICGPGERLTKSKRHHDQIILGADAWTRIYLNQGMKSTKTSLKLQDES